MGRGLVQVGPVEIGAAQVGVVRHGGPALCAVAHREAGAGLGGDLAGTQVGGLQIGVGQVRAAEHGAAQVGADQAGPGQHRAHQDGAEEVGPVRAHPRQVASGHVGAGEVSLGEVAAVEVQAHQVEHPQDQSRAAAAPGDEGFVGLDHPDQLTLGYGGWYGVARRARRGVHGQDAAQARSASVGGDPALDIPAPDIVEYPVCNPGRKLRST